MARDTRDMVQQYTTRVIAFVVRIKEDSASRRFASSSISSFHSVWWRVHDAKRLLTLNGNLDIIGPSATVYVAKQGK
jgi:hypothetical protein